MATVLTQTGAQVQADLNLVESLQPAFDPTSTYAVGDLVIYDSKIYKCVSPITVAAAWDINDWTQVYLDDLGGFVNPMTAAGDIIIGGTSGDATRLAKGTAGQVLTINNAGTAPEWVTPSGGGGIQNYEIIDKVNTLPTATSTSADFVQYNTHLYRKQIRTDTPTTITDLTDTTWYISDYSPLVSIDMFNINFVSNSYNCTEFQIMGKGLGYYVPSLDDSIVVYTLTWLDPAYRTIQITGGTDATNSTLISWLQANATIQPVTIYEYIEIQDFLNITPMENPMTTAGDIIIGGISGAAQRLTKGTAGQVLTMNSGATAPEWQTPSGGAGSTGITVGDKIRSLYVNNNIGKSRLNTLLASLTYNDTLYISEVLQPICVHNIIAGTGHIFDITTTVYKYIFSIDLNKLGTAVGVAGCSGYLLVSAMEESINPIYATEWSAANVQLAQLMGVAIDSAGFQTTYIDMLLSYIGGEIPPEYEQAYYQYPVYAELSFVDSDFTLLNELFSKIPGTFDGHFVTKEYVDSQNPMTTAGDIIYGGASGTPTRLAKGTAGQVLAMNSGATAPEWVNATGGSTITMVRWS